MARLENSYPIGERLPGTKYVVVRKLGRGGMGVVLAVVKEPGIRAVVKIIHPFLAAEAEFRQRFFDEVRILAKLDHPNIVKVTDFDQLANGMPYFAMELLQGSTIRQVLRATGAIHPTHLYEVMRGLLEGLEYVHTHAPPIVHRDIKCENVFIHAPPFGDPCVKVIDFGVAWGVSAVEDEGFFGTRRYAAPEQFRGGRVTFKADIYSAGLILYEALAGRGPFDDIPMIHADEGNRMKAFARAHLAYVPPSIRTFAPWVPASIDALLQSALEKDPDKRPESANAFASKLYVLQFLRDGPLGNTTIQNLNTMAQLSAVAEPESDAAEPASQRPAEPSSGSSSSQNDTVVIEGPVPWLDQDANAGQEPQAPSGPTVLMPSGVVMLAQTGKTMAATAASPLPPPKRPEARPETRPEPHVLAAAAGRPRSFAEAEQAALRARGVGPPATAQQGGSTLASGANPAADAAQQDARRQFEKRAQFDAASFARLEETEHRRRPAADARSSRLRHLPLIALAATIPMLAVAVVIFLLTRATSNKTSTTTTASSAPPSEATSGKTTAAIPLLPPEVPSSASPSGSSRPQR